MKLWTNSDFDSLVKTMNRKDRALRHEVRYACFRFQKELAEGKKAEQSHHKIAKQVEAAKGFAGWNKFGITWDISTPNPITIVERKWSIYEEWNQVVNRVTVPLEIVTPH
jgi:hypothetical protein